MNTCNKCQTALDDWYIDIRGYLYCAECVMYIPKRIKEEIINNCKEHVADTDVSRIKNILYNKPSFHQRDMSNATLHSLK